MKKIALSVEYNGASYSGWQKQQDRLNVQGTLEQALSQVADETIQVVCAGRTDTGVHAYGQVVHFETQVDRTDRAWVLGTNTHLPNNISVSSAKVQDNDFHARFSATARRYVYLLSNRQTKPAIFHDHLAWEFKQLSVESMQAAIPALLGEHDFSAFRAANCQAKSPVRTILDFSIKQYDNLIAFDITANAFLYHMVRNIVGSMLEVGLGEQSPEWIADVIATCDRRRAGMTAPACGLYFLGALYPEHYQIPPIESYDLIRQFL